MIIFRTHLLCGAVALLLLGGCSKNMIYIDGGTGTTTEPEQPTEGTSLVTFHASVENRNMTRAMSPLRKSIQAQIFAFQGSVANASGSSVNEGLFFAPTPGLLQGIDGFKMYLPNGAYDFYAVSDNTQYPAPTFSEGLSEPLLNETDYLWWCALQQDITSDHAGIPIVFLHCATQIIFEVEAGEGVAINQLALAHIFPPVEGVQMALSTGIISPATAYQTTISKMTVSGLIVQYTMLPVVSNAPLQVSFDVIINGELSPRTYDVQVPLPDGELKAGNSYRFKAVIQGNEITFPSVGVTNWVDVDETGKPLYPSEM